MVERPNADSSEANVSHMEFKWRNCKVVVYRLNVNEALFFSLFRYFLIVRTPDYVYVLSRHKQHRRFPFAIYLLHLAISSSQITLYPSTSFTLNMPCNCRGKFHL